MDAKQSYIYKVLGQNTKKIKLSAINQYYHIYDKICTSISIHIKIQNSILFGPILWLELEKLSKEKPLTIN